MLHSLITDQPRVIIHHRSVHRYVVGLHIGAFTQLVLGESGGKANQNRQSLAEQNHCIQRALVVRLDEQRLVWPTATPVPPQVRDTVTSTSFKCKCTMVVFSRTKNSVCL